MERRTAKYLLPLSSECDSRRTHCRRHARHPQHARSQRWRKGEHRAPLAPSQPNPRIFLYCSFKRLSRACAVDWVKSRDGGPAPLSVTALDRQSSSSHDLPKSSPSLDPSPPCPLIYCSVVLGKIFFYHGFTVSSIIYPHLCAAPFLHFLFICLLLSSFPSSLLSGRNVRRLQDSRLSFALSSVSRQAFASS